MAANNDRALPLTKRVHALNSVSCGLAILSRKGRGRAAVALPLYLSPCGRGYAGRAGIPLLPPVVPKAPMEQLKLFLLAGC